MVQKNYMKSNLQLFGTGVLQVFFVAVNTVFLSKHIALGILFAAFMISMVWSYNIKKIVFGTLRDRIFYSCGAATGSLLGLYASDLLIEIIKTLCQ